MKQWGIKQIIYALIAAMSVTTCGVMAVHAYQDGNSFIPSGVERGFNANQVSFSGDSDIHNDSDSDENDGESELWEKDKDAEDKTKPQGSDKADYLFKTDEAVADGMTDQTLVTDGSASVASSGASAGASDGVYSIIGDKSNADIIISGGNSESGATSSGGSSDDNSGGSSDSGHNGGNDGNHNSDQNIPAGPDNGNQNGSGSGGTGGSASGGGTTTPDTPVTPDKPNYSESAKDPEPGGNTSTGGSLIYDEKNVKPAEDPDENGDYAGVIISKPLDRSGDTPFLYKGQQVNEKIIFSSLNMLIIGKPATGEKDIYQFGDKALDKYIKIAGISFDGQKTWITEFPVTIPSDVEDGMMFIKVEYRVSTSSSKWIERNVAYDPEPAVLYVLSKQLEKENETIQADSILNIDNTRYPSEGSIINLYGYQDKILGAKSNEPITKLFPGWTENGKLVPFRYTSTIGRHILEPTDLIDLNEDYYAELKLTWMDAQGNIDPEAVSNLVYLQTLRNYSPKSIFAAFNSLLTGNTQVQTLKVPKYIQSVDMEKDADIIADYIDIPSTVIYINNNSAGLRIKKGYIVDEDNEYYSSKDGVLCNKEKTEILGVPYQMTHIEVPDIVTKVNLDKYNSINTITLKASSMEELPEIEYDNISSCKIVVDESVFDSFLAEYYEHFTDETGNTLASSADPDISYHVCNGILVNSNGMIKRVIESASSNIMLADSMKSIGAGAFADHSEITEIILNESIVPKFEEGCFDGSSINTIFCHTKKQYDSVIEQLKVLDVKDIDVKQLSSSKEEFSYLIKNDGQENNVILISAPDGITEFDGKVTAGDGSTVTVTAINDGAFSNSSELKWVTLPESVKTIGSGAFKNCSNLVGVLIDSKDNIRIENKAFDGCDALRFIASNAMNGSIADGYIPYVADKYGPQNSNSKFFFALPEAKGYEAFANQLVGSEHVAQYTLEDINGGKSKVLYASNADRTPCVALRAEKELPDEVVLPESTIEIYYCAFADSVAASGSGKFTITNFTNKNIWSVGSGAFKNSELAGNLIVSNESTGGDIIIGADAFSGCNITGIDVEGMLISLGESVFYGCKYLEKASFDNMTKSQYVRSFFYPGTFTGCDKLEKLTFNWIPNISVWDMLPFQFNYDWSADEEAQRIKITVPEGTEETLVHDWRYSFAGYSGAMYDNAYMQMRDAIKFNNIDWSTFEYPSEETVDGILFKELLAAENRVRTMIGAKPVEEPTDLYQYHVDVDGYITLTAVPSYVTDVTLSYNTMDMPKEWSIDYIAAGAFSKCKDLKSVTVPEALAGIESGAFKGVESDQLTLKFESDAVPELQMTDGKPFDFGIDPEKLRIDVPQGYVSNYITYWAFPMAGYTSLSDIFYKFYDEMEKEMNGDGTDGDSASGDTDDIGGSDSSGGAGADGEHSDSDDSGAQNSGTQVDSGNNGGDAGSDEDIFNKVFSLSDEEDVIDTVDGEEEASYEEASYEEIYTAVYAKMATTLMPAENKLRKMFGLDEITDYKDLICLQGYEVIDLIDEAKIVDTDEDQETEEDITDDDAGNAGMNEEMPDADNNSGASGSAGAAAPDDTAGGGNGADTDPGYLIEPDGSDAEADKDTGEGSGGDGAGDDKNYSASDNGSQSASEENHTDTDSENGEDREQENAE